MQPDYILFGPFDGRRFVAFVELVLNRLRVGGGIRDTGNRCGGNPMWHARKKRAEGWSQASWPPEGNAGHDASEQGDILQGDKADACRRQLVY